MKTTLELPDELVQAVKVRAVLERRPMKELVADYIRLGLGLKEEEAVPSVPCGVALSPLGLPVVRAAHGTPKMTVAELLAIERDAQKGEDLQRAGVPL